jgi:LiaI-LiaF-like transmembrane region
MRRKREGSLTAGVVLVAVGGVLLATRFVPVAAAPAWLLGLGVALALLGIVRRAYGVLVAGMVLLGLGAGMVLGDRDVLGVSIRGWRLIALGAAFALIVPIAELLRLKRRVWPLVVGAVLIVIGAAPFLRRFMFVPPWAEEAARTWWPALLVAFGIAVIVRALRRG